MIKVISSDQNKLYKETLKLLQKKYRDKLGRYIIEGIKIFEEKKDKIEIEYIILNEKLEERYEYLKNSTYDIYIVSEKMFSKLSDQVNSQGVLIVAKKNDNSFLDIKDDIVVLDSIQDPGNLGTIIRTMVAFNFKNLVVTKETCDVFSPKVLRATMGSVFDINIYVEDKKNIIDFLKNKCYNVLTTELDKSSVLLENIELKEKNAYIFGQEGNGISKEFKEISNQKVIIPISSAVNSLNVAISTAIFLYEVNKLGGKNE